MIRLGLERITRLLKDTPIPWKAIHVAGTNGKGSICAYSAQMLKAVGVRTGRFTSPHTFDRWDCIEIGAKPVEKQLFEDVEREVLAYNKQEKIDASEFEILTATAFKIFTREKIEVGVVECGMGGRLDATNVLQSAAVAVIAKVGLDHQAFLGDTIEKIAQEKAGIIKPGVPCVVNGTNPLQVLNVIQKKVDEVGAQGPFVVKNSITMIEEDEDVRRWNTVEKNLLKDLEEFQKVNLRCAMDASICAIRSIGREFDIGKANRMVQAALAHPLPGRLHELRLGRLCRQRSQRVILDGAHNEDAARALKLYVENTHLRVRKQTPPVVWLLAFTEGKNVEGILRILLAPRDSVVAVEFGPVDGMPWIKPMPAADIVELATKTTGLQTAVSYGSNVLKGVRQAVSLARQGIHDFGIEHPMVITGSLYLGSQILRLRRELKRTDKEEEDRKKKLQAEKLAKRKAEAAARST